MVLEISNFGRVQLADLLSELDFKTGVEVGVAEGWYSSVLMKANPQMQLYGVDPFVPYKGYTDYQKESTFARLEETAKMRLSRYPNYELIKDFSVYAVERFKNESLDFVYIDANHADPYVSEDIRIWFPKLRKGGIMAGHDYTRTRDYRNDTIRATQKFAKNNNLILFILGTNAMREGEVRDQPRSWMWIK